MMSVLPAPGDPGIAQAVRKVLGTKRYAVEVMARLADTLHRLAGGAADALRLDLALRGAAPLEMASKIKRVPSPGGDR